MPPLSSFSSLLSPFWGGVSRPTSLGFPNPRPSLPYLPVARTRALAWKRRWTMNDRSNSSMTQTNWDLIRDAASGSSTAKASLDAVMKRAWPAVYAYIRATGRRSEEATELTQAFICDVFLARHLLEKADQSRGRFRTLLIGAVRNYLADTHRRATAAIRAPKSGVVAIDALSESGFDRACIQRALRRRTDTRRQRTAAARARIRGRPCVVGDLPPARAAGGVPGRCARLRRDRAAARDRAWCLRCQAAGGQASFCGHPDGRAARDHR